AVLGEQRKKGVVPSVSEGGVIGVTISSAWVDVKQAIPFAFEDRTYDRQLPAALQSSIPLVCIEKVVYRNRLRYCIPNMPCLMKVGIDIPRTRLLVLRCDPKGIRYQGVAADQATKVKTNV